MTKNNFSELIEYVNNWDKIEGNKPVNEGVFVNGFFNLIRNYPDDREVEFDGDGSYFGKQIRLLPDTFYGIGTRELQFEVAYSDDQISVYTANHAGFWNPEYLSMHKSHPDFEEVKEELHKFLKKVFGL